MNKISTISGKFSPNLLWSKSITLIAMIFIGIHVRNPTYRTYRNSVSNTILRNSHLCNQPIYVPKCSNRIEAKNVSIKLKVIEAVKVRSYGLYLYTRTLGAMCCSWTVPNFWTEQIAKLSIKSHQLDRITILSKTIGHTRVGTARDLFTERSELKKAVLLISMNFIFLKI